MNAAQPVGKLQDEWYGGRMSSQDQTTKPKRQVSYNEDAILCPVCKKRIRLNNNGRVRIHVAGKMGSGKCMGSNAEPLAAPINFAETNDTAEPKPTDPSLLQKDELVQDSLFSDIA